MKKIIVIICLIVPVLCVTCKQEDERIDRKALLKRNNPQVSSFDSLASLSVGNGEFAVTVDATGLQTFPELYAKGVPLGTQAQWGWHSFGNPDNYRFEETLKEFDFGHDGRKELYSVQFNEEGRPKHAANWYRANPHRLHLGILGLELDENMDYKSFTDIHQTLVLEKGLIESSYKLTGQPVRVETCVHPDKDMLAVKVCSPLRPALKLRFPYPTGQHTDDACDWNSDEKHKTETGLLTPNSAVLRRIIDSTVYYVSVEWKGKATFAEKSKNCFIITPEEDSVSITCSFMPYQPQEQNPDFEATAVTSAAYWHDFWYDGAAIDFSDCTDPRAKELERRVVLSQYLLAIQCSGSTPPQETGLTYNSWFGKFHLEMIWWHEAQFALWNRPQLLARTMDWYEKAAPTARQIAERQGFNGIRWMKMTDPGGLEAPSGVGSFLIWQQPHYIYLAELLYRDSPDDSILNRYYPLVQETARFMYDFATCEEEKDRYVLKGIIPAQETLRASETVNSPFELSYWHTGMSLAQKWRERKGEERNPEWDKLMEKLSPLAYNEDNLYLAAETAPDTYKDIRFTSDHPAVLGAWGILPESRLVRKDLMLNTLNWVWDNWNWNRTWGWDYPMVAMAAARLGEPEKAVAALLMDRRTNTYLVNGHNYQDDRLRIYLPGNGGLLTAIAMMCAGWDGCREKNPGFPKDGNWNVKWEGLKRMI
ncbi:MAG: hypothetical protein LBS50_05890 [Prevotellaceae bacterium]|jgi:hypothetical protein|nr:hypothetical protein [Prevotellaceae bacterium]